MMTETTLKGFCDLHDSYINDCVDCTKADIELCEKRIDYLNTRMDDADSTEDQLQKIVNKIDGYYSIIKVHEDFLETKRIEDHPSLNIQPELVDLWKKYYDQGSFGIKLHVSKNWKIDDRGFETTELDYELAEIEIQSDDEVSNNSYLLANALYSLLDDEEIKEKLKSKFFELLKEKIEEES